MVICQTLWTNKKSLLENDFGWLTPQHHLMGWALSALKLCKHYTDVRLFTDGIGKETLIDRIGLPYTYCFEEYNNFDYQSCLWALPKMLTYAKQEQPFLHVDGDVIVWEPFNKKLLSSGLIAQNLEIGTEYYKNLFMPLLKELRYIPPVLRANLKLPNMKAFNAGIMGGQDYVFFKRFVSQAIRLLEKNKGTELNGSLNMIIEQLLFYSFSKKEGKRVSCFTDRTYNDHGYEFRDFADFLNVQKLKYLHLIGTFKRTKEILDWLARYLRQENEEIFLRIIELFKKQHYFYGSKLREVYPTVISENKNKFKYIKTERFVKSLEPNVHFESNISLKRYIKKSANPLLYQLFSYEQKLQKICAIFSKINFNTLNKLENSALESLRFISSNKKKRLQMMLNRNSHLEIIHSAFNWPTFNIQATGAINVSCSYRKDIIIGVIPELFFSGYREITLDEICVNIIVLVDNGISYQDLLTKMVPLLRPSKNESEDNAFTELIYLKVEFLIKNKILFIHD